MSFYNFKIIISNNILEIYKYGKLQNKDFKRVDKKIFMQDLNEKIEDDELISEDEEERENFKNRYKSMIRARNNIKRICNANTEIWNSFITLTFEDHINTLESAHLKFKSFLKRVNKYQNRFNTDFKYLAVVEFTKIGRVHYHLLTNIKLNYSSKLKGAKTKEQKEFELMFSRNVWKFGFVDIRSIDYIDNVGAYLVKYMTKEFIHENNTYMVSKQLYRCSRNLNKSFEMTFNNFDKKDRELIEYILNAYNFKINDTEEVFYKRYTSEYTGIVEYFEYNNKRVNIM